MIPSMKKHIVQWKNRQTSTDYANDYEKDGQKEEWKQKDAFAMIQARDAGRLGLSTESQGETRHIEEMF